MSSVCTYYYNGSINFFIQKLPHPWFIIEDAHINVVGVMRHFHKHLLKGDYLIIEDTNPLAPAKLIQGYTAPGFKGVGEFGGTGSDVCYESV
jgi:hypothetical protein